MRDSRAVRRLRAGFALMKTSTCRPALVAAATLTAAGMTLVAPATVVGRQAAPELVWETAGFVAPESVVFDQERKQFYVSNMGTWGPGSTPGDGFISRVSADGRVLESEMGDGLR